MGKILTSTKGFAAAAEERIAQKFAKLRSDAQPVSLPYSYLNDPVFFELELARDHFLPHQDVYYPGVRYHLFHCRSGAMTADPIGRFDSNPPDRETPSYPRHLIPSAEEYADSLKWLATPGEHRGSGRTTLMAHAFLERGLHFVETKIRYFDHGDHYDGGDHKVMYDRLRDLTWNSDLLKTRYVFSRDTRGPHFIVARPGESEIVLGR